MREKQEANEENTGVLKEKEIRQKYSN